MTPFDPPDSSSIDRLAEHQDLTLTEDERAVIQDVLDRFGEMLAYVDEETGSCSDGERRPHDPCSVPFAEDDPYNAVVSTCDVSRNEIGPLSDLDIGLKDNIALAGVELTNGSTAFDGFVPKCDATVVSRILSGAGTITAKLNLSAMSFFSDPATGPVRNPHDPERAAGGSSSGPAVAVTTGIVDVALGTDQGGSIRAPAAWSGCVGLKPSWGRAPYTGITGLEPTLDHVGPLGRSVEDCARVLSVMAGDDSADPRQRRPTPAAESYQEHLSTDISDLTVGVLAEGFGAGIDDEIELAVRDAIHEFEVLGATVTDVSVPAADQGDFVWTAIAAEGIAASFRGNGIPFGTKGWADSSMATGFGRALEEAGDAFPLPLKAMLVAGEYLTRVHHGHYYTAGQQLGRDLTVAYDGAFEEVDVLALPTMGSLAAKIDDHHSKSDIPNLLGDVEPAGSIRSQFNVTGHPAVSIPCGTVEELPVGLQLVAPHFDEATLLRSAHAFETKVDWSQPGD